MSAWIERFSEGQRVTINDIDFEVVRAAGSELRLRPQRAVDQENFAEALSEKEQVQPTRQQRRAWDRKQEKERERKAREQWQAGIHAPKRRRVAEEA
jgi:hypothetical protein